MDILLSPVLWLGLGLLLVVLVIGSRGGSSKKMAARMARVTRKRALNPQSNIQSLKRQTPGSDTAFGQALSSMRSVAKLQARLEVAGMAETSPQKFLKVMGGIMAGTTFFLWLFLGKPLFVALPLGIVVGLAIPHLVVGRRIKKRQMQFLKLFPDAIDLMVRGLRAGLPVAESFITVSKELPPPMGDTFANISHQTQLGVPMEKALADNANKLALTEFNFFVTTIILQRETGGNLGEILNNLADMLRQRHMMKMKIGAMSSEARASAYIIGALPFVVFGILMAVSPDYLKPLFDDARGNKALAMAGGSLFMGGFIMKRMTQLEI